MLFASTTIRIPDIGGLVDTSNIIIVDMATRDGIAAGGCMDMKTGIKTTAGTGNLTGIIMLPVTASTQGGRGIYESIEYIDAPVVN